MKFLKWMAAALVTFALPLTAAAQTDSGRISGNVIDQTSAFVPGATVTVKNTKTGETRAVTTDENGHFLLTPLKPSTYTITVQKAGFAVIEYTDMPVAVGQELALDFAFKQATAQEAGAHSRIPEIASLELIELARELRCIHARRPCSGHERAGARARHANRQEPFVLEDGQKPGVREEREEPRRHGERKRPFAQVLT